MEWTKKRIAGAGAGLLVVIALIPSDDTTTNTAAGGSAAQAAGQSQTATQTRTETVAAAASKPSLELSLPSDRTVYRDRVTVAGRVTAENGGSTSGVTVTVEGRTAPVRNGRWSKTVTVHGGGNAIEVEATKDGHLSAAGEVELTRERSKAQRAAVAAKRRAEAAAKKQNFMASARSIPYNQLEKNADRFSGDRAVFRGQIMQIQEEYGSTFMLLSVTDEGYGFWTDNVWVDYEGTIKGAEDDIVTVYGTIEGSKSYDTQIGGETYVPQMTARYVVE